MADETGESWSWYESDNEAVIVPSVQGVAVYTNPSGDVVVRQQDTTDGDDSVIVIPRSMVKIVAKAMVVEVKKKFTKG